MMDLAERPARVELQHKVAGKAAKAVSKALPNHRASRRSSARG